MIQSKDKVLLILVNFLFLIIVNITSFSYKIEAADLGAIRSGETRSSSIDPAGDTDSFTFYGEKEDTVIIVMKVFEGNYWFDEYIELYDPKGYLEKSAYDRISDYKLLATGIYTIVCKDFGNDETGKYNLSFIKIPGPLLSPGDKEGGDISSGDVKKGEIKQKGDIDGFNFNGKKGETVVIQMKVYQGDYWFGEYIELYDPEGYLEKSAFDSISNYKLLKGGLYTIICSDFGNDETGKYNLSFTKIPSSRSPGIYQPNPENGAGVPYTINRIEWNSKWADMYDVYFGTNVLTPLKRIRKNTKKSFNAVPSLEANTTYYWRIVGKRNTGEERPGPVWMFTAGNPPKIRLSRTYLSFKGIKGQANPSPKHFRIRNDGIKKINYEIDTNRNWLNVTPKSGKSSGEWDTIETSVKISKLNEGNYKGTIIITSKEAINSPQKINIDLLILSDEPFMEISKKAFSFSGYKGGQNPPQQTFRIRNGTIGTLEYQITTNQKWLKVTPKKGNSQGEWDKITVSVVLSGVKKGKYNGIIKVISKNASNSPQIINVDLTVFSPPLIKLNKDSLVFKGVEGESNPQSQSFKIKNSRKGTLSYEIKSSKKWIKVSPQNGVSSGEWDNIKVTVDISSLEEAQYTGRIEVNCAEASNSPKKVNVKLTVERPTIFPPLNFSGKKQENRWMFKVEYINILRWMANSLNENKNIDKYRIYLRKGKEFGLLIELDSNAFEYQQRNVEKEKEYVYKIVSVDYKNREGNPAFLNIK